MTSIRRAPKLDRVRGCAHRLLHPVGGAAWRTWMLWGDSLRPQCSSALPRVLELYISTAISSITRPRLEFVFTIFTPRELEAAAECATRGRAPLVLCSDTRSVRSHRVPSDSQPISIHYWTQPFPPLTGTPLNWMIEIGGARRCSGCAVSHNS